MQDPLLSKAQVRLVIDDVLRSLWFFTDTVQLVIQTPVEHVKIKAYHSGMETIQDDSFLPG